MGFVRGIIGLALAILFAIFAVANRETVSIVWSPIHPALDLPVYLVALSMLALGFLLGAFFAWLSTLPVRLEKTKQKRQIQKLEKELGEIKPKTPENMVQDWTALPPGKSQTEN